MGRMARMAASWHAPPSMGLCGTALERPADQSETCHGHWTSERTAESCQNQQVWVFSVTRRSAFVAIPSLFWQDTVTIASPMAGLALKTWRSIAEYYQVST